MPEAHEALEKGNSQRGLPKMGGTSTGMLMFVRVNVMESSHENDVESSAQVDTMNSSLKVLPIPPSKCDLADLQKDIERNMSCIIKARAGEIHTGLPCFRHLVAMLKRLSQKDVDKLTMKYLRNKRSEVAGQTMIDALGTAQTSDCYTVMMRRVLLAKRPEAELLMRALFQLFELSAPIPKIVFSTLEDVVFRHPFNFSDDKVTEQLNDRATLALASVAKQVMNSRPAWASNVVQRLEQRLGVHDPHHHRQLRSTMKEKELHDHLNWKTLHIHALGNAASDSSLGHLMSFMNDSDAHTNLRYSAVDALAKYSHKHVADVLLSLALTDKEENVRFVATNRYKRHPYGGDIRALLDPVYRRSHNVTQEEHSRMKRSLSDSLSRIWKGFSFHLKSPTINWVKHIGGRLLGASMGAIARNQIDIEIKPLQGHMKVDLLDSVFATLHIGLMRFDYDIFRAEFCYNGGIEYELNILKEFNYEEIKKVFDLFVNVVPKVVKTIKTAVNTFKRLISTFKNVDFNTIINGLIDSVKQMVHKVTDLRRIGSRIYKAVGKFDELPPVMMKVKNLVTRVTTLFKDIKNDVMGLYNAIADSIKTVIPWAWKEIKTSFSGLVGAIPKLLKNPQWAIQKIGEAIVRISTAIAAVIDAKNKVKEANFFTKENRPYWFDIKKEVTEIWDGVLDIKQSIVDTMESFNNDDDDIASRFTGINLATMKKAALAEIKSVLLEELEGPMNSLKQLFKPFQQAQDLFVQLVKNIKEAWRSIVVGYQTIRTQLEQIFGPKVHEDFPRKLLVSSSCGDGFWETTGKSHYSHNGIMLKVDAGHEIVAPYGGRLRKTGSRQITISVGNMKNVEIIIDNVELNVEEKEVAAGEAVGRGVTPQWCSDTHIHVAMVKTGTVEEIDPTGYLRKRNMPLPKWVQNCNHYILHWKVFVTSQGNFMGSSKESDTTPAVSRPTEDLNIDAIEESDRKKRGLSDFLDTVNDFGQSLGLPNLLALKDVLNFNMNSIRLKTVFDFLGDTTQQKLKSTINKVLKEVERVTNQQDCNNPATMDDTELKQALVMRGLSVIGARQTLVNRYLKSDPHCLDIGNQVGPNVYCRFDETCTSISCCINLKLFIYRHSLKAFIRYDPCDMELRLGFNAWTTSYSVVDENFGIEETVDISGELNALNVVPLHLKLKIQRTSNAIKISLGVFWCSTRIDDCMSEVVIMNEAEIEISPCVNNEKQPVMTHSVDTPTVEGMLNMDIGNVIKVVDANGVDTLTMIEMVEGLREAFHQWLTNKIESLMASIFGSEFNRFDICLAGPAKTFGPYYKEIYKLDPPHVIPVGPIPLQFKFGINGYYGAKFTSKICFLTMKATGTIVPQIGSLVWGSLGLSIDVLTAELRLTGYLLTTSFPINVIIEFNKFPFEVRARVDLVLIPLHIKLRALLKFKLCIYIPWKGMMCWRRTLINKLLWHYQSKAINKNLLNFNNAEADLTAPDFGSYAKANCTNCKSSVVKRSADRQSSAVACRVVQLERQDYTEPAFNIEFGVADDRSEVELSYCVGTYSGGCDVVNNEPLGGPSTVVSRRMVHSVPLYFRVKAKNSMGMASTISCQLPTYDMTLPEGRVMFDFSSTSHTGLLQGSTLALDDTVITSQMISVGYGKGSHGTQVVNWQNTSSTKAVSHVNTDDDPLGLRLLEHFAAPREGRLVAEPRKTLHFHYAQACARACLGLPATACLSFNYDYSAAGVCQLMDHVEGHTTHVRQSGLFHYFERHGIGHVTSVQFDSLNLEHNRIVYLNYYLQNLLDYKNMISSTGLLVDVSPPVPGLIINATYDNFTHDACVNYVPQIWQQRCAPETASPTHRSIIDGDGSMTVFNGHEPLVDGIYTRANRMFTANWDGIYDNETGILMYTWAVGTELCGDDILPFNDPHEHLASAAEWNNIGVAFPLNLPDNQYYVTVRAINNIEFGPLALTVCHSQPYTIDATPPIIYDIYDVNYDEDNFIISFFVNATDPVSQIRIAEMGLGLSRKDTFILEWTPIQNFSRVQYTFNIPNGVPVWVKMRFTNNVDLSTVGHAEKSITVDSSAPIAGQVYDGDKIKKDATFQSSSTRYCANWHGFNDPQSGILTFVFALGTTAGADDVVNYTRLSYDQTSYCVDGLQLQHKHTYIASVTAINAALIERNVTAHSDGVYVDTTPPVKGLVSDGKNPDTDTMYTSEPATVASTWKQFSDPESGLRCYHVGIYRKAAGKFNEESLIHTEKTATSVNMLELHHFHLHHSDFVRVNVTATNKAELSSSATSDGFTVDLTKPKMLLLVDGDDPQNDLQYTDSTTTLTATWSFVDPESMIDHYKISAYEIHGGKLSLIYPTSADWKTIPGSATKWTTDETLDLKIGARYKMLVSAVNKAGLTAVHYTNGLLVDPTPPEIMFVHAGALLGESEELIDGYVVHHNEEGIQASWTAIDVESGIQQYLVGIGTARGQTDLLDFQSMGLSEDGYINNVNLALTDVSTNSPVYYVTVKAINRAGKESAVMSSSPIRMVSGDIAGVVYDGPDTRVDIDYDLDMSDVSVTFSGYESQRDGVSHYYWAVGSAPRLDDVMPYSSADLLTNDGEIDGILGIGGSGKGHSQLALSVGVKYYISVRALTGAGTVLESTSDGFVVDVTPPVATITSVGNVLLNTSAAVSVVYQEETDLFTATWYVNDPVSKVTDMWLRQGTYPDADNINPSMWIGNITSLQNGLITPRTGGQANIITIDTTNVVGLTTTRMSPVLTVDTSAPLEGIVNCPEFVQGGDSLECSWSGFVEKESEIDFYKFGVGKVEGDDSVFTFHHVIAGVTSHRATGMKDGGLKHQTTYYVTVTAINKVGLSTTAYSKPLLIDNTPPQGRVVVELPDVYNTSTNELVLAQQSDTHRAAMLVNIDATCQRVLTQMSVAWQPFEDPETEVIRYQVALGSTPGGTQIHPFEDISSGALSTVINYLDLSHQRRVFATVKGYNAAGLHSTSTSNGVYVSRISAGLEPLGVSYVYDGSDANKDLDLQGHNDGLSAHWHFSGDPCPIEKFEWAIHKFDGTVLVNMTELPAGATAAEADELQLKDGESYFVIVRATNKLGYIHTIHSNGVTVKLEPLLPGSVLDGDIAGVDLNYQLSLTSLSANWDGFGQPKDGDTDTVVSEGGSVDATIGDQVKIDHYEVAVGTNPRYPVSKTDVLPFTNVGLNVTWTFTDLELVSQTVTYYTTVRAYSVLSAMVEVTSNGIKVGYGSSVVSTGTLELAKYSSSATELSFSWSGFKFLLPVKFYQWGMGTVDAALTSLTCGSLLKREANGSVVQNTNYSHLFDVHPLTSVNLDTSVIQGGLKLVQGETYHVLVIAVDESGGCVETSGVVTVDTTPPQNGHIGVGPEYDLKVLYSPSSDAVTIWWTDFGDLESGIKNFQVRLLNGADSCIAGSAENMTTVVGWTALPANSTSYTFAHIHLQESSVYYVELQVTNGADLVRSAISRPVLLDVAPLTVGSVKHGDNFRAGIAYQNSTDMHGVLLYLPSSTRAACPQRTYSMSSPDQHWMPLVHKYLRGLQNVKQDGVIFQDFMLSYSSAGLGVTLRRDVKTAQMLSGAIQIDSDIENGGTYLFNIQAAGGSLRAVTSVVFFDGPKGVFADYTPVLFDGDTARPAESGLRSNGMKVISRDLPGDTSSQVPEVELQERRAFGFQIYPSASYKGKSSNWMVLWSSKSNKSSHTIIELDFDPAATSHAYKLTVNEDEDMVDEVNWELKLYVDDKQRVLLGGTTSVSSRTQLTLGVYNRHGWVAPLEDVFYPPKTTAHFQDLQFPPASSELCRFGDPFQGGAYPVVEFLAAVGTSADADDIQTYQKIAHPCIPCQHTCDEFICSESCNADKTQVIHFNISGLALEPQQTVMNGNETVLQPYYLTVKAVTGSGRSVQASSVGVYIDTTPPVIQMIYHVDLSWSSSEPSSFQGGNTSMAVYYEAVDEESEVIDAWWAIGSSPGGTDVQPFVNIGTESFVSNTSLEGLLFENHTYYVTLMCVNGAGLTTTNSSEGVTIVTTSPNADNVATEMEDTAIFGNAPADVPAVKSSHQDTVGIKWEKSSEEEHIDSVYFSVGSDGGKDEICAEQQVGVGEYGGSVSLSSEGIKMSAGGFDTTTSRRRKRSVGGEYLMEPGRVGRGIKMTAGGFDLTTSRRHKRNAGSEFLMEPGRTLRINLRICTKAHRCSQVPVKPILIVRDSDTVAETKEGQLMLTLARTDDPEKIVIIKAVESQTNNTMLVGGLLSEEDVNSQYDSAESDSFKSFIVDPVSTQDKTDRYLRNRIRQWDGTTVFISTLPDQKVEGPFIITMPFDKSQAQNFSQDFLPRILRWCADNEMWIDAGRTCDKLEDNRQIDWDKGLVSVKVCHSASVCEEGSKKGRSKRAVPDSGGGSGAGLYSVGSVDNTFFNSPPVITSESNVNIFEDDPFTFDITADDSDGDDLYFLLNSTSSPPMGNVTLSPEGKLFYTPCTDCFGVDTVHFTVWENRSDEELALSVDGHLVVNITGINNTPNLQMFNEGRNIIPPSSVVTMNIEENDGTGSADHDMVTVLAAYDGDYNDAITLTFEPPKHGNMTMHTRVRNVSLVEQDCSQSWQTRRSLWDHLIDDISSDATPQYVSLPNPCGTDLLRYHLTWVITLLRYTPFEGYIGEDSIKIAATDGKLQDLLTVSMYILRNPCMNKGICKGPDTDPECTSTTRTTGFNGYQCECPSGFLGVYCETDVNECDSSPCPTNHTCVNGEGHYECYCHRDWPCHVELSTEQPSVVLPVEPSTEEPPVVLPVEPSTEEPPVVLPVESALESWHIALLIVGVCLLLIIVGAAIFVVKKCARKEKVAPLVEVTKVKVAPLVEVTKVKVAPLVEEGTRQEDEQQSTPALVTARSIQLITHEQGCSDGVPNMPACE